MTERAEKAGDKGAKATRRDKEYADKGKNESFGEKYLGWNRFGTREVGNTNSKTETIEREPNGQRKE